MKDVIEFNGKVNENGILHVFNRKVFDEAVKRFAGKDIEITVKKKKSVRSSQQNRYYFGIVIPVLQNGLNEVGYDMNKQDVHEFIKANFCYNEIVNKETGEIFRVTKSTTRLNKSEFSEMIEKIKIFASEYLNVLIPDATAELTIL